MSKASIPWGTIIKVLVSLVLLIILGLVADPVRIGQALAGFSWGWLGPVLVLVAASVVVSALKWGVLLKAQGYAVHMARLTGAYSTALFFNNFLPSSIGGDGVRILLAGRQGIPAADASASVVVERTLATASLGLLGVLAGLASSRQSPLALGLLGLVAFFGLALTLVLVSGWLPGPVLRGKGKVSAFLRDFSAAAGKLRTEGRALLVSFGLSFVFQTLVAAVVAAVAAGMGLPFLGAADVIHVTSASSVLAMVPLGLNGYGLREGAFMYLLQPYGIDGGSAIGLSVLFALSVSLYSLVGAWYWVASKGKLAQA